MQCRTSHLSAISIQIFFIFSYLSTRLVNSAALRFLVDVRNELLSEPWRTVSKRSPKPGLKLSPFAVHHLKFSHHNMNVPCTCMCYVYIYIRLSVCLPACLPTLSISESISMSMLTSLCTDLQTYTYASYAHTHTPAHVLVDMCARVLAFRHGIQVRRTTGIPDFPVSVVNSKGIDLSLLMMAAA